MPNVGQRIVLSVEVDQTTARATSRLEGGFQPECVSGYCEALFLEKVADCIVCSVLLVCGFGVGPDLALSVRNLRRSMGLIGYILVQSAQGNIRRFQGLVNRRLDLLDGWVEDGHGTRRDDDCGQVWAVAVYEQAEQLRNLRVPRDLGDGRL